MLSKISLYQFQKSTLICFLLSGALLGLFVARFGISPSFEQIILTYALLPLLAKGKYPALIAIFILGLSFGLWRGSKVFSDLVSYRSLYGNKITISGKVADDPAYNDLGQIEFHIVDISDLRSDLRLPGRVRVSGFGAASVKRGDVVTVSGKLREGYGNRQGSISYATIEVNYRDNSFLERARAKFFAGVFSTISEPQASLGLGFLVGTRTLLPAYLTKQLSITGLSHIVAVSGYNLTILIRLMRRFFAKGSAYMSLLTSFMLIAAFLLVTGISPSIARAAVVSTLALFAWYYGRKIRPAIILLFSAVLTAFISPFYLWYDLGWYLSFAAFFGVLVISPLVIKRIYKDNKPKLISQLIIETTSAQTMAVPIIAVVFGELSVISILANMLVLPLIPLAMLLTFVAGVVGAVVPSVAGWLAWPANMILGYIVGIVHYLANIPNALVGIEMSWIQLATIYGFVVLILIIISKKIKTNLSGIEFIE